MNKIKYFVLALMAACVSTAFVACGDDDEKIVEKWNDRIVTKTDTVKVTDDSNWARLRKRKGQLEIDADLVIDEDTVLPSEDGGMEVWIQAGKDDIVVDT